MEPLSALSPSKQNVRASDFFSRHEQTSPGKVSIMANAPISPPDSPNQDDILNDYHDAPSSPRPVSSHSTQSLSPTKARSPIKYKLQDDEQFRSSPPGSPAGGTMRFNEGLTRAIDDLQKDAETAEQSHFNTTAYDEGMSTIHHSPTKTDEADVTEFTIDLDKSDETVGDLSTISAIQTDMTRFTALRDSTVKIARDSGSPSREMQETVLATPGQPRPLLLGRTSTGSIDEEETPRRPRSTASPTDLMNFTGLTNIHIPPPESAPRTARRSPSGRTGFPIRVNLSLNPTPSHRSQASLDREQSVTGRSTRKTFPDRSIPSTPASSRHSMYGAPTGFGMDLLDIDLEPMATPRSIPTITARELETLRSEMQSRISGLEATLSGKEAEVMALKRAITDAEVRAGKVSEELRTERSEKEELSQHRDDMERRTREMEDVLRELKQNAFVEEREREKLRKQAEDAEQKAEEHEVKILELNASLETLRSDRVKNAPSPQKYTQPATPGIGSGQNTTVDVDAAIKNATETVARELHALYKSKHERKVSDLKSSYEKRWIKQVEQLRSELKEAQDEISRLHLEQDATFSGALPAQIQNQSEQLSRMEGQIEELRRFNEETTADKKMLEAEVAGLSNMLESVRADNRSLQKEVNSERLEKDELVAQVEVFLQVSAEQEKEIEQARQREREREIEMEREAERARERELQDEIRSPRRQPVSPPRSDSDASSTTSSHLAPRPNSSMSINSPNKFRNSISNSTALYTNGVNTGTPSINGMNASRPRPMSMLQKPTAGKFAGSGIPGPGSSGLKAPASKIGGYNSRGGLMEGITRMGAGR